MSASQGQELQPEPHAHDGAEPALIDCGLALSTMQRARWQRRWCSRFQRLQQTACRRWFRAEVGRSLARLFMRNFYAHTQRHSQAPHLVLAKAKALAMAKGSGRSKCQSKAFRMPGTSVQRTTLVPHLKGLGFGFGIRIVVAGGALRLCRSHRRTIINQNQKPKYFWR